MKRAIVHRNTAGYHALAMTVKSVTVLGTPVGNLWDVFTFDKFRARVTYHGYTLIVVKGDLPTCKEAVENRIDALYQFG